MAVYLSGGSVLLDSGLIATSIDCCCGGGETGGCCVGDTCSILTSEECSAQHGTYRGNGTDCFGVDCTIEPQFGCCICPDLGESCAGAYSCRILSTDCNDPCTFFPGFGGYGPSSCCDVCEHGTTVSVCFDWPPTLASYCCPCYPPAGINRCCFIGVEGDPDFPHYTCCGQGDDSCCNDSTEQCCENVDPESGDPFNYCCGLDGTCCGFFGCCPSGTTCTELGCV